jgi:hypothetical protein
MGFVEIVNLFSAQAASTCSDCMGSAFSPIAAAWATQGYWMQATLIEYLKDSGLSTFAALIYVFAVGAGIVGYMLGNPPRNYVWYFFGPAMFHFLLFTTEQTKGVSWQMGINNQGEPIYGDQREVWKLAEAGLVNQEGRLRKGIEVFRDREPSQPIEVAQVFAFVDTLFSDLIQGLVGLVGSKVMMANAGAATNTNIPDVGGGAGGNFVNLSPDAFYRISNSKWGMLENITGANIKDIKMIKAMAVFMGSDCGDELLRMIDQSKYTTAARARGGSLPASVFHQFGRATQPEYPELRSNLQKTIVHKNDFLRQMFPDVSCGGPNDNSLTCFSDLTLQAKNDMLNNDIAGITCENYLAYLIEGMRWEAGNATYQLYNSAPAGLPSRFTLFNLFYGWGIRDGSIDYGTGEITLQGAPIPASGGGGKSLETFTPMLMLVHIIKNFFEYTPITPDQKYTPSQDIDEWYRRQQKQISSKTKFLEVYSWALMVPYVQGLALYFLATAYPIVCIAMIMPQLYKLPITWIKYWLWAKSWDLGFAIVMAVEKSVWATMSNSDRSQRTLGYVVEIANTLPLDITCNGVGVNAGTGRGCAFALVRDAGGVALGDAYFTDQMRIFDRTLMLSKNLELDLANSYYIYIMAALYFAVPAIAGQLVGSIGGLAGNMLDKFTDVKAAANAGYTSDKNQRLQSWGQLYGQELALSAQRSGNGLSDARTNQKGQNYSSLGSTALGMGNKGAEGGAGDAKGSSSAGGTSGAPPTTGTPPKPKPAGLNSPVGKGGMGSDTTGAVPTASQQAGQGGLPLAQGARLAAAVAGAAIPGLRPAMAAGQAAMNAMGAAGLGGVMGGAQGAAAMAGGGQRAGTPNKLSQDANVQGSTHARQQGPVSAPTAGPVPGSSLTNQANGQANRAGSLASNIARGAQVAGAAVGAAAQSTPVGQVAAVAGRAVASAMSGGGVASVASGVAGAANSVAAVGGRVAAGASQAMAMSGSVRSAALQNGAALATAAVQTAAGSPMLAANTMASSPIGQMAMRQMGINGASRVAAGSISASGSSSSVTPAMVSGTQVRGATAGGVAVGGGVSLQSSVAGISATPQESGAAQLSTQGMMAGSISASGSSSVTPPAMAAGIQAPAATIGGATVRGVAGGSVSAATSASPAPQPQSPSVYQMLATGVGAASGVVMGPAASAGVGAGLSYAFGGGAPLSARSDSGAVSSSSTGVAPAATSAASYTAAASGGASFAAPSYSSPSYSAPSQSFSSSSSSTQGYMGSSSSAQMGSVSSGGSTGFSGASGVSGAPIYNGAAPSSQGSIASSGAGATFNSAQSAPSAPAPSSSISTGGAATFGQNAPFSGSPNVNIASSSAVSATAPASRGGSRPAINDLASGAPQSASRGSPRPIVPRVA